MADQSNLQMRLRDNVAQQCFSAERPTGDNGTLARYVLDRQEDRLYPHVTTEALLRAASRAAAPDDGDARLHVAPQCAPLNKLHQVLIRELDSLNGTLLNIEQVLIDTLRDARQQLRNREPVDPVVRKLDAALENVRAVIGEQLSRFPALSTRLPAVTIDERAMAAPAETRVGEVDHAARDALLQRIQNAAAVMGRFRVIRGTDEAFARKRANLKDVRIWHQLCHRLDRDPTYKPYKQFPDVVVDDIEQNTFVLRGTGRLVSFWLANGTREEHRTFVKNLFLLYPGRFTFKHYPLPSSAIQLRKPIDKYVQDNIPVDAHPDWPKNIDLSNRVFIRLDLPTLVEETNQVLLAGFYRIDLTNYLTFHNNRTVAIRSAYREHKTGRLRFAEYRLQKAIFDDWETQHKEDNIVSARYAGNANIFLAVDEQDDQVDLLGYWVGTIEYELMRMSQSAMEIRVNHSVGLVGEQVRDPIVHTCQVREPDAWQSDVDIRPVSRFLSSGERQLFNVVRLNHVNDSRERVDIRESLAGSVHRALFVDFFCAAPAGRQSCFIDRTRQSPSSSPATRPIIGAPKERYVAPLLLLYVITYYTVHGVDAVMLYTRMWQPRLKLQAKMEQMSFASSLVANFYYQTIGLQFVPFINIAQRETAKVRRYRDDNIALDVEQRTLFAESDVRQQIALETGLLHLLERQSPNGEDTIGEWIAKDNVTYQDLRQHDDDFCYVEPLIRAAADRRTGIIDSNKLLSAPVLYSNYFWRYPDYMPADDDDDFKRESDGLMFRYYPTLAELQERLATLVKRFAADPAAIDVTLAEQVRSEARGIAGLTEQIANMIASTNSDELGVKQLLQRLATMPGASAASWESDPAGDTWAHTAVVEGQPTAEEPPPAAVSGRGSRRRSAVAAGGSLAPSAAERSTTKKSTKSPKRPATKRTERSPKKAKTPKQTRRTSPRPRTPVQQRQKRATATSSKRSTLRQSAPAAVGEKSAAVTRGADVLDDVKNCLERYFPALKLHELISRGGTSAVSVYRATDGKQKEYAVRAERLNDKDDENSFDQHAEIALKAGELKVGPAVYKRPQFCTCGAIKYGILVTEYIPYTLQSIGKLSGAFATRIEQALFAKLRTFHEAGYVHLDVRPPNVVLRFARLRDLPKNEDDTSWIYLIDYGMSESIKDFSPEEHEANFKKKIQVLIENYPNKYPSFKDVDQIEGFQNLDYEQRTQLIDQKFVYDFMTEMLA